jgi:hypothetical protein
MLWVGFGWLGVWAERADPLGCGDGPWIERYWEAAVEKGGRGSDRLLRTVGTAPLLRLSIVWLASWGLPIWRYVWGRGFVYTELK